LIDVSQLYLIHWPTAFKSKRDILKLFPLRADGLVDIDDDISIVDTWKGMLL
jgi:diketogulonate reductase-like aldo/keto reductase